MTAIQLTGSLLACVEVDRLVHAYYPKMRITLSGRNVDAEVMRNIHPSDVRDGDHVVCPRCARCLANMP